MTFTARPISYCVHCVKTLLAVLVEHRLLTDGRTDGLIDKQTHDHRIYRANIASRGKMCLESTLVVYSIYHTAYVTLVNST